MRLGDTIDKDMIAIPIGPELRMAAVASPEYFSRYPIPQTPHELTQHCCINQRMVKSGGLYVWDFDQEGGDLNVRVNGQVTFNTSEHIVTAALAGLGIAFLPEQEFGAHIEEGRLFGAGNLVPAIFPGYYLYYPSRKQVSPAFSRVIDALRVYRRRQPVDKNR